MFEKFRVTRLVLRIVCLLSFVALSGCAGALLNRIGGEKELPKDIPQELQDRFEVKEHDGPPLVKVSENAASVPKSQAKKRKSKKLEAKATPAKSGSATAPSPADAAKGDFKYPIRRPEKSAIWVGEKQVYDVSYFGISAGDFTVTVEPFKWVGGRKAYHVRGSAISSKVFSLFYRLNDEVETFIDYDGIFSHRFHILLDESKQARDALELNDSLKGQTYYWNRWQRKDQPYIETKEYFPIQPFSQDSLSALYYLRSVPLPDGAVITFPVINEGKTWEAQVTVLRREMMDTPMGRIRTVVLKPDAKYQGILKKQGDNFLWLTDDDRKYLVRLEAKVKIGTVVAMLKAVEPGTPPVPEAAPAPAPSPMSQSTN